MLKVNIITQPGKAPNHNSLFEKLSNTKYLEDKIITRKLFEKISVDELCDDRVIETVP